MELQSVIKELQEMRAADEAARNENPINWDKTNAIDKANTTRLKEIIKEHGWITIAKFGTEASQNCWLLAQHADLDPAFQRECLDLISQFPEEEVDPANVAFLTDRVLIKEVGIQRYGTQMHGRGSKFMVMAPVESMENLDTLRNEMGLEPIREKIKKFSRMTFLTEDDLEKYKKSHLEE